MISIFLPVIENETSYSGQVQNRASQTESGIGLKHRKGKSIARNFPCCQKDVMQILTDEINNICRKHFKMKLTKVNNRGSGFRSLAWFDSTLRILT